MCDGQVPEECPAGIERLIDDCMEKPPEERPSAREAFQVIKHHLSPCQVCLFFPEIPNVVESLYSITHLLPYTLLHSVDMRRTRSVQK